MIFFLTKNVIALFPFARKVYNVKKDFVGGSTSNKTRQAFALLNKIQLATFEFSLELWTFDR